ncbi:MAG: hypothetical protein H9535_19735 [Ignavibacteria bacterium]|nr:hypothetical protein [Ignavibacteria bacterium]MBL7990397.1 hypothetical protein [Candidatus Kapabacteria bacterium]
MNETPRIENVSLISPKPPAPDMTPKRAVLPQSVVSAVKLYHERLAEAELNAYQRLYEQGKYSAEEIALLVEAGKITERKNILEIIQQQGVEALIIMVWNFIKTNLRTTIAGLVFVLAQVAAKIGLSLPVGLSDTLFGVSYIFLFNLADKKISPQWIAGAALTVLSLFLTPVAGLLGLGANPLVLTTLQFGLQQFVALLLKDQPDLQEIARRTGAMPAAVILIIVVVSVVVV